MGRFNSQLPFLVCTPTEWSEWTECDAPLGSWGQKKRFRECVCPEGSEEFASNPDCGCGEPEECETCKGEPLCEWSGWGEPTAPCSTTCGGGTTPRDRTCNKKPEPEDENPEVTHECPNPEDVEEGCRGDFKENTPCSVDACPPKCTHGDWTEWTGCSATCGGGKDRRDRPCNCPEGVPTSECDKGGQCDGEPIEEVDCNVDVDCCKYGDEWETWGPCTVTCGTGTRSRQKPCECEGSDECGGCEGLQPSGFEDCNSQPCSCWGDWKPWSDCPDSCGTSFKNRTRDCTCGDAGDGPNGDGPGCEEEGWEQAQCEGDSCQWDCWSEWTECSAICDDGQRTASRICNCPDGVDETECGCDGEDSKEEPCNNGSCEDCKYCIKCKQQL